MSKQEYGGLPPTQIYKGVPIFLYQDDDKEAWEYGAMVGWHGRMIPATLEEWEQPTLKNVLKAARLLIDIATAPELQEHIGPDGYLKPEGGGR